MKKYTLKRIITSLFTLLAILLVLFILMQLMPGSPFNDEKLTPEMRASPVRKVRSGSAYLCAVLPLCDQHAAR